VAVVAIVAVEVEEETIAMIGTVVVTTVVAAAVEEVTVVVAVHRRGAIATAVVGAVRDRMNANGDIIDEATGGRMKTAMKIIQSWLL